MFLVLIVYGTYASAAAKSGATCTVSVRKKAGIHYFACAGSCSGVPCDPVAFDENGSGNWVASCGCGQDNACFGEVELLPDHQISIACTNQHCGGSCVAIYPSGANWFTSCSCP